MCIDNQSDGKTTDVTIKKRSFALLRVSKLSQIDEFPSDHLQTTQRS